MIATVPVRIAHRPAQIDVVMTANPQALVERFYFALWHREDPGVAEEILADDFRFRGSLGLERRGRDAFVDYMHAIHRALAAYRCEIPTPSAAPGIRRRPSVPTRATGSR